MYALIAWILTTRLLISLAEMHNLIVHQMGLKQHFFNSYVDEESYMKQP